MSEQDGPGTEFYTTALTCGTCGGDLNKSGQWLRCRAHFTRKIAALEAETERLYTETPRSKLGSSRGALYEIIAIAQEVLDHTKDEELKEPQVGGVLLKEEEGYSNDAISMNVNRAVDALTKSDNKLLGIHIVSITNQLRNQRDDHAKASSHKDNLVELLEEDLECVHLFLDDQNVRRKNPGDEKWSIVGRIKTLLEKIDGYRENDKLNHRKDIRKLLKGYTEGSKPTWFRATMEDILEGKGHGGIQS